MSTLLITLSRGFNSQASYEARRLEFFPFCLMQCFNSQASYEARLPLLRNRIPELSFNSQASYEARRLGFCSASQQPAVSIHRPHTRPDATRTQKRTSWTISIHRPHTRPDVNLKADTTLYPEFQFTGLIRGPT